MGSIRVAAGDGRSGVVLLLLVDGGRCRRVTVMDVLGNHTRPTRVEGDVSGGHGLDALSRRSSIITAGCGVETRLVVAINLFSLGRSVCWTRDCVPVSHGYNFDHDLPTYLPR